MSVYTKYHSLVNMSYNELLEWSKTPCSELASLDRSPITRNLRLLSRNKSEWTKKDEFDAKRTISFISRMRKAQQGKSVGNCGSRRDISLKNWAYDPDK